MSHSIFFQKKKDKLYNTNKENVAVSGYDVVAYFTQDGLVNGNRNIISKYQGITYWFAT